MTTKERRGHRERGGANGTKKIKQWNWGLENSRRLQERIEEGDHREGDVVMRDHGEIGMPGPKQRKRVGENI